MDMQKRRYILRQSKVIFFYTSIKKKEWTENHADSFFAPTNYFGWIEEKVN